MQMLIYPLIVILGFFAYTHDWQTIQNDTLSRDISRNVGTSLKVYRRAVGNYADSNCSFWFSWRNLDWPAQDASLFGRIRRLGRIA